jgi:hypothetical protein
MAFCRNSNVYAIGLALLIVCTPIVPLGATAAKLMSTSWGEHQSSNNSDAGFLPHIL